MRVAPIVALLFVTLVFAGCVGGSSKTTHGGPNVEIEKDAAAIRGIVVDDELVPLDGVTVSDEGAGLAMLTDSTGQFVLGPLQAGEHVLTASKPGYETITLSVQVYDVPVEGIRFLLNAVATTVPYHETIPYVTFVNCASKNPIGGTPCTALPDYVLGGHTISPDESFAFPFTVPAPNLADLLIEMRWTQQTFASDMSFKIQTPPGQPATAAATSYFYMEGGQPLRGWVQANIDNDGEDGNWAVFDAEPNKVTYEGMTIWSGNNATVPGVPGYASGTTLYFNHRTEAWMTYFYNRPGTRDFTALPDQ